MNFNIEEHLPEDFHDNSRVWIYQSSRLFTLSEAMQLEEMLNDFTVSWKSHGADVKGYANLFFGQFICIMADETTAGVSGCSTDSSVRVIKEIEQRFNVQLFDRQSLAFWIKDKVQLLPFSQLSYAAENKFITRDTLYFNNTVLSKKDMIDNWIIPVKSSWLAKRMTIAPVKE
ncbi:MAG: hypothetical protein QM791_01600 [Ferruginibacter sp.]